MPKGNLQWEPTPEQLHNRRLAAAYLFVVVLGVSFTVYVSTAAVSSSKTTTAKIPKKAPVTKIPRPPVSEITKKLDAIKIKIPIFDLSSSPVPNLKISPLNLSLPQLPGKGMLENFGVDKDVAYKGGAVEIPIPEVDVTKYLPTDIPTGGAPTEIPTGSAPSSPSVETPSAPEQSQVNQSNCAQFSGIPSCSYVGDSNGQTLCNQCKAAGF